MTLLLILAVAALVAIAATVHDLYHDGRGMLPPPASHAEDPATVPPRRLLSLGR